jgi:hypothetical protein
MLVKKHRKALLGGLQGPTRAGTTSEKQNGQGTRCGQRLEPGASAPVFELWINWICGKEGPQQKGSLDEPMKGIGRKSAVPCVPTKRVKRPGKMSSQLNGLKLKVSSSC